MTPSSARLLSTDISLRDVRQSDLPIFFAQQREPDANRMAAFPARENAAFIAHWAKILSDPAVVVKTVCIDDEVVGNVMSWQAGDKRLIGYWIGKSYWGRGIATKALSEYLQLVTKRPLHAFVAKQNIASVRVLKKCGFAVDEDDPASLQPAEDGVEELLLRLDDKAC